MQNKAFTKFVNDLRCPLCNSQLDGNVNQYKADLFCVSIPEEYKVYYKPNETLPDFEKIVYYFDSTCYEITSNRQGEIFDTFIFKVDLTLNLKYRTQMAEKLLELHSSRINYFSSYMTEKQFLKKLKYYVTFS